MGTRPNREEPRADPLPKHLNTPAQATRERRSPCRSEELNLAQGVTKLRRAATPRINNMIAILAASQLYG
jgi:hypothetical protein